ncbi:MAG: 2-oxo acid dehydrogenase subunit E2 [Planctomycetes bacterium]|nr:2-oxo acid dehydrogenase subunit E2 [Planctomycetota bacterium]
MAHATSSNPNEFILPDLGEGVHEAELKEWRVKVGDHVDEHETLAEMETDKALVEVPSPRTGVIKSLHGEPGEILIVGSTLVTYEPDDNSRTDERPKSKRASKRALSKKSAAGANAHEDAGTVVGAVPGAAAGVSAAPGKTLATPAVRRLARDLGIEINSLTGTGIGGRVTEKDVRAAVTGQAAPPRPAARAEPAGVIAPPAHAIPTPPPVKIPPGEAVVRIPFRGVRRKIAARLRQSLDNAAHFYVMDEADATALDALRKNLGSASGEKVSFLPFVASAISRVLTDDRFRAMNAVVDDANEEIVQHRAVHMGIAVDTDAGLMVPVIRDCDALGVLQIGREVARISAAARNRSIPRDQLVGSTFTISNVGSHAGRYATPIINYPEVAIIAIGRARDGMVFNNGWFRVGTLLPLSLACDHRVVDGAIAASALAQIIRLLQDPEQLLAPARQ